MLSENSLSHFATLYFYFPYIFLFLRLFLQSLVHIFKPVSQSYYNVVPLEYGNSRIFSLIKNSTAFLWPFQRIAENFNSSAIKDLKYVENNKKILRTYNPANKKDLRRWSEILIISCSNNSSPILHS